MGTVLLIILGVIVVIVFLVGALIHAAQAEADARTLGDKNLSDDDPRIQGIVDDYDLRRKKS